MKFRSGLSDGLKGILKRQRKIIAVVFIVLLVSVAALSDAAISLQNQNAAYIHSGDINLTVTPKKLVSTALNHGTFQIQIFGEVPQSLERNLSVSINSGNVTTHPYEINQYNDGYLRAFITIRPSEVLGNHPVGIISFNDTLHFAFHLNVVHSNRPLIIETLIGLTSVFYLLVLIGWDFSNRRLFLMLIPVYIALAALFGQRYDSFFMISTGIRLYGGVNPFVHSALFPPSLKWEYPPLYLLYSMFSYVAAHLAGLPALSNELLNFPGTVSGFTYMAWRALNGIYLIPYYALIKVPMMAATVGTYLLLVRNGYIDSSRANRYWLLNPYVLVVGIAWGQLDVLSAFFLLFSIVELRQGKTGTSAVMAALGTSFKIFPVFLLPLILLNSRRKVRDLGLFLLVLSPDIVMYYLTGSVIVSLKELFFSRSVPTFFGLFSSNGVSWQVIVRSLGVETFPSLFLYVFIPFYIVLTAFLLIRKIQPNPGRYMIVVLTVFFLTYNYVNPQYFIWVIPLLLIELEYSSAFFLSLIPVVYLFLTYSLTYFINPYLSYNYFSSPLGQLEAEKVSFMSSLLLPFIILANAYFILLLYRNIRKLYGSGPDGPNRTEQLDQQAE